MSGTLVLKNREQSPTEVRNHGVDFRPKLDVGELLIGAVTVTIDQVTVPPLVVSSPQVSTTQLVINDKPVPTGQAVAFRCSGGKSGVSYVLTVSVGTNAVPAQTLEARLPLTITP